MGIRQSMRPRHQVLVLKCYPRYQKSTTEVKPNSSELSYLLYYASTRRSKLQKVGEFLDHQTQTDVRKARLGNVQVTLQIVTALIEKCTRDLPLYASSVLSILSTLLNSGDVNLVEESVQAFTAFCTSCDHNALSANPDHSKGYDNIVQTYSSFASKRTPTSGTSRGNTVSESLRFRIAGLSAIKALTSAESFAADGKYIKVVIPPILENLWSEKPGHLHLIEQRESAGDQHEKELSLRRRQSMSVQRSTEIQRSAELNETDPSAASVSTADVDRRSNEEAGVLALKSLRSLFAADNRGQVRLAASAALNFAVRQKLKPSSPDGPSFPANSQANWTVELFDKICRWTPVQDRFIILVTVMESLISSPVIENDFKHQSSHIAVLSWLLRSDINFIGLSVMDVLLGLMQHALLLLQVTARDSISPSQPQQSTDAQSTHAKDSVAPSESPLAAQTLSSAPKQPSATRVQLLEQLKDCIGDLATHVYYSDQISDIILELMNRLKPTPAKGIGSSAEAIEDPRTTAANMAELNNLKDKMQSDGFFSFDTARLLALKAAKKVLLVANSQRDNGSNATGRHRVETSVWDGTQWLLRDPDASVRDAYVDVIITWLQLEMEKRHLRLNVESSRLLRSKSKARDNTDGSLLARRVLSNASQKLKADSQERGSFLELLHLAIYENALSYATSEADMIRLHVLLTTLVQSLGINSIRIGLPMIFRLQYDFQFITDPTAMIAVASLVHGYLWTVCRFFEIENTVLGEEVTNEITRRSNKGIWLKSISNPPLSLDQLGTPEARTAESLAVESGASNESLLTFGSRQDLIDHICTAYSISAMSPPTSPPSSPQRTFSRPSIAGRKTSMSIPTIEKTLPARVKEQMMEGWSREACIAAAESGVAKALSANGSRSGSGSGRRSAGGTDGRNRNESPEFINPNGVFAGINTSIRLNNRFETSFYPSANAGRPHAPAVLRIQDLKRVLSGNFADVPPISSRQSQDVYDTASQSLASASYSASESSLPQTNNVVDTSFPPRPVRRSRSGSTNQEPPPPSIDASSASSWREADPLYHQPPPDSDIPPVPMLPANLRATNLTVPVTNLPSKVASSTAPTYSSSAPNTNDTSQDPAHGRTGRTDIQALLKEIDTQPRRQGISYVAAPPY